MSSARIQSGLAVALSLVLVASTAGIGVAVPDSNQSAVGQEAPDSDDETAEVADEAYVTEDGDVVLVYNDSTSDPAAGGHLGANLSEGLFHLFLNDTVDEMNGTSGSASLALTPDELTGGADLLTEKPDNVADLSLSASGVTTTEESSASMSLDASLVDESSSFFEDESSTSFLSTADAAAQSSPSGTLETEGSVTTTGSQFLTSGSTTVAVEDSEAMDGQEMAYAVALSEQDEDYLLEVQREEQVSERSADRWSSEEAARQSIEAQFSPVGQQLDGEVAVDIESYSFDSDTRQLDIEYSVTFSGVEEAVAAELTTSLTRSPQFDITESEAEALTDRIREMELTELSGSVDVSSGEATTEWSVQIDEYDEALMAVFDISQAARTAGDQMEALEESRARFKLQRDANLTQTVTWEASASADEKQVDVSMNAEQRTENWREYVSLVQDHTDLSMGGDTEFDIEAETTDGDIQADASFSLRQENMINQTIDSLRQQATGTAGLGDQAPVESFQRADLDTARMDMSIEEGVMTLEAGANFENATELAGLFEEMYGETGDLQRLYTQPEKNSEKTYVRIGNALDSDPAESDVRQLATVDAETTVYLPGEWDQEQREFPQMDTETVRTYLETEDDDEDNMDMMMPIVVGGAALALAGGAVLGLRRRP